MKTDIFETCMSNHHEPIGVMLTSKFVKGKPYKIFYSCHKNFGNENFIEKLKSNYFQCKFLNDFSLYLNYP